MDSSVRPIPANATPKQRMARKLRTKPGRAAYRRRKAIVEPVFGQITTVQNGRRLLLRGIDGARGHPGGSPAGRTDDRSRRP